ncbi:MAG: hypothetical protein E5Y26_11125, partial [Mesorhizobium sp.]
RDSEYAMAFIDDLSRRLANRVQLTSDDPVVRYVGPASCCSKKVSTPCPWDSNELPAKPWELFASDRRRWPHRPWLLARPSGLRLSPRAGQHSLPLRPTCHKLGGSVSSLRTRYRALYPPSSKCVR